MKKMHLNLLAAVGALGLVRTEGSATEIIVTADELREATLPKMASLATAATSDADWVTVGKTFVTDGTTSDGTSFTYSEELAHLDADGNLVLVDDGGNQRHAVWLNRDVYATDAWAVRFTYTPDRSASKHPDYAGGWTFVLQASGPEAYSASADAVLGAPAKSYGFLFHHYFGAARWVENSSQTSDWAAKFNGKFGGGTNTDGSGMDITKPMDVSIGCTNGLWTVTLRQDGVDDVVLTHDFAEALGEMSDTWTMGLTGASAQWGGVCQKFSGISGSVLSEQLGASMAAEYALTADTWSCADMNRVGDSRFDENGLVIEEAHPEGNVKTRKYAAVGSMPLYRSAAFQLTFDWIGSDPKSGGAAGVSFALVPNSDAKIGDGDYFPKDPGAVGFYIRSYNTEGFGWFENGTRFDPSQAGVYLPGLFTTDGTEPCRVTVEYDGTGKVKVQVSGLKNVDGVHSRVSFEEEMTYENLPEKFYPAFFGSTSGWDSSMTVYVQNYDLRVRMNSTRELGDVAVTGEQVYRLGTLNGLPSDPSAHASRMTLEDGATVRVESLEPASSADPVGGTLAVDELVVNGCATVTAMASATFQLNRLAVSAGAKLTLSGAVGVPEPLEVVLDPAAFPASAGAQTLMDATAATLGADVSFRLLDTKGQEIPRSTGRLIWKDGVLKYKPLAGLLLLIK